MSARMFLSTVFCALVFATGAFADEFSGTWQVTDTKGQPFEIVLAADGTATANRSGEGMKGTWEPSEGVALISWETGWTTKIWKDGNSYKKSVIPKGQNETAEPTAAVKKP